MEGKDRQKKKNKSQGGEKSLSSSFLPFYLREKKFCVGGRKGEKGEREEGKGRKEEGRTREREEG